ncbi:MAG: transposase [Shimia sp.]|nr:transposase [Shimia sp.]
MEHNGGYILHLDGTCEGASPMLMAGLDSITEIVLGSVKAPTERAEYITPFLKDIQIRYGDPIATVRDMGQGIGKAIQEVFAQAKDFICHFHFLRDIGKDLLGEDYDTIRKRLRNYGVRAKLGRHARALQTTFEQNPALLDVLPFTSEPASVPDALLKHTPAVCAYALIQWTLAGLHHGDGYGFPFDRPHLELAKRLSVLRQKLQALENLPWRGQWRDNDPFRKTLAAIGPLLDDSALPKAIASIERDIQVFDALRDAMRLAPQHGSQGLNDSGQQEDIQTIEAGVKRFRHWLTTHPAGANDPGYANLLGQLDRYWEKLFADPILVNTPAGPVQIQPQRTNNIMERFFRGEKQGNRRRTGNIRLGKMIQTMLADTPLVKNLDNPRYLEILLEQHQTLEGVFAEIDRNGVRTRLLEAQQPADKVPAKIQRLIAESEFPEIIHAGFSKLCQTLKNGPDSNRSLEQ